MKKSLLLLMAVSFFVPSANATSLMCALFLNWDIDNVISKVEKPYDPKGSVILSDKDEIDRNPRFFFRAQVENGKIQSVYMRDVVTGWQQTKYRDVESNSEYLSVSFFEEDREYSLACWNFPKK